MPNIMAIHLEGVISVWTWWTDQQTNIATHAACMAFNLLE